MVEALFSRLLRVLLYGVVAVLVVALWPWYCHASRTVLMFDVAELLGV